MTKTLTKAIADLEDVKEQMAGSIDDAIAVLKGIRDMLPCDDAVSISHFEERLNAAVEDAKEGGGLTEDFVKGLIAALTMLKQEPLVQPKKKPRTRRKPEEE